MAGKNSYFAEVLKEWLVAKGITAHKLAEILQCSRSAAYQYVDGRVPEWEFLLKVSDLTGFPIESLLRPQLNTKQPPSGPIESTTAGLTPPGYDLIRLPRGDPRLLDDAEAELLEKSLVLFRASGRTAHYGESLRSSVNSLHTGFLESNSSQYLAGKRKKAG